MTAFPALSLFEPEPVPGLSYRPDVMTPAEEQALLAEIDDRPWLMDIKRRRQWYGKSYYDSDKGEARDLPPVIRSWAARLTEEGYFRDVPDRAGVNEYYPGQGIGAHSDRLPEIIETVAILSLGSAIALEFSRDGHETRDYYLQPRSLVFMEGEARFDWKHRIAPRHKDRVGGLLLPRARRVSVTLRGRKSI
ncbi:alpha-ketoglutarate-dependent dioxygenase AlkB [Asticcacaulis sp. YBE204]|uniref:alpha-ketoglutarate-dependent dioxygenase AlkB n=1 Tax=Asticcacaulis sp. YBE204 TaxID=1282363 RepID=UPI0003C3B7C6|nr:alpha-ketoglutarate-dependent dioxygenase AlkB [Asticcacaulis sp. YBE204]ESQ78524.1 hypothetical protein AEYBE204_13320 [Asticcacaulis sp. YBE204]